MSSSLPSVRALRSLRSLLGRPAFASLGPRCAGVVAALLLAAAAPSLAGELPAGDDFGAAIQLRGPTPLARILAQPERYADAPVLVRGRVVDVCQKKGCWTVLSDGRSQVRIRFHDYGFFLPKDATGRVAYAEGRVAVETLSEETAKHYEAESRSGDPERISGPQRIVGFTATGVRLVATR